MSLHDVKTFPSLAAQQSQHAPVSCRRNSAELLSQPPVVSRFEPPRRSLFASPGSGVVCGRSWRPRSWSIEFGSARRTVLRKSEYYIMISKPVSHNAVHSHATRRSAELSLPRIRTGAGRRRLCCRGAALLNELDLGEAVPFKATLRKTLLERQRGEE